MEGAGHYKARMIDNNTMVIPKNGKVTGAGKIKKLEKLNKQINVYINGYIKALFNRELPAPGAGDCWYCAWGNEKGSLGELTGNKDHLLSHFKEKYYVPSLIINAIKQMPISIIAESELWYCFKMHNQSVDCFSKIAKRQITSSLKRYLRNQLGLAR